MFGVIRTGKQSVTPAMLNASGGKVSASLSQWRQIAGAVAGLLTIPLTVAVHPFKKPFIHAGFINLNTDGTLLFSRIGTTIN
jgi:hypothetical protein